MRQVTVFGESNPPIDISRVEGATTIFYKDANGKLVGVIRKVYYGSTNKVSFEATIGVAGVTVYDQPTREAVAKQLIAAGYTLYIEE